MKPRRHLLLLALGALLLGAYAWHRYAAESADDPPVAIGPHGPVQVVAVPVARPRKAPVVVTGQPQVPRAKPRAITDTLIDPKAPYAVRMDGIRALGRQIPDETVAVLLDGLRDVGTDDGLSLEQRHALKNELMNVLRKQDYPVFGLAEVLADIFRHDPDAVMQAYALQHLDSYRKVALQKSPSDVRLIDTILWEAVARDDAAASTALIALAGRPEATSDAAFRARLAPRAVALASSAAAAPGDRVTALSLCGELALTEALPLARQLAETGDNLALQAAALAVLGHSPSDADRAYLRRISQTGPTALRAAATHALAVSSALSSSHT